MSEEKRPALVLTHGAGSNRDAPLLVAVASTLEAVGWKVRRVNLPFRERRPKGPPVRSDAVRDREGLRAAVAEMRRESGGPLYLGGASYGGRQASILAAEIDGLVDGLLLLSYPLHPPGKPEKLRTDHFPELRVPVFFVQGARDPFGSFDELTEAAGAIPGRTEVLGVERAGHDLKRGKELDLGPVLSFFDPDQPAQQRGH